MVGNVDAGKSTFIGTLISGLKDDGNGKVREFVLNHFHEKDSRGKTSSLAYLIIGFDENGNQVLP